jgi:hypothetical protein
VVPSYSAVILFEWPVAVLAATVMFIKRHLAKDCGMDCNRLRRRPGRSPALHGPSSPKTVKLLSPSHLQHVVVMYP